MSRWAELSAGGRAAVAALGLALVLAAPAVAQQAPPAGQAAKPAIPGQSGLGRPALPGEVAAWDIDVRPDGRGLPVGKGTVKQGEDIYMAQCASCHGEFGEGVGRWPVLAGGQGSLKGEGPEKTIGSYWPYFSTTFDYVNRAMPYGNARSLTADEVYAVTAYLLFLNDVVKDDFELSNASFGSVKLPNVGGFLPDDRETAEKHFWKKDPCMANCTPTQPKVTGRARVLDVTPDSKTGPKVD
jgi:cytochrome c